MDNQIESQNRTRRDVLAGAARLTVSGALAAVLARAGAARALAQASPPAGETYPELTVTITDAAVQLSAQTVPAGLVLLTVVNQTQDETGAGVIGPAPGQTMQDLQNAAATPVPGEEFPAFLYTATILGGPTSVEPGQTSQAIVKLTAGDWAIMTEGEQPPAFFSATAGASSNQTEPEATVTITEVDFAFGGFGVAIPAGQQTWQITNQGTQPHMLVLTQAPAGTTLDQVIAGVNRPENATPAAGELRDEDMQDRGGVIMQSPGTTVWLPLDLPAGRYLAMCFVPDPVHGGVLHAMEGMVAVFDVGA